MLVHIADPWCPWCHAFAPAVEAVAARWPQLPLQLVMGGLRHESEPMSEAVRTHLRGHWQEVARRTGAAIDTRALDRPSQVYDCEPASRAVVVMREHTPDLGWPMLRAVQHALFEQGEDITQAPVLARLAQTLGVSGDAFLRAHASAVARDAAATDFTAVRRLDIRGFPVLLLAHPDWPQPRPVQAGWCTVEAAVARVHKALDDTRPA